MGPQMPDELGMAVAAIGGETGAHLFASLVAACPVAVEDCDALNPRAPLRFTV